MVGLLVETLFGPLQKKHNIDRNMDYDEGLTI